MSKPNTLEIGDLRARLRKKEKPLTCTSCTEHKATDVHHLNGHHWDNEPGNLAPWCKRCHDEHHGITDQLNDLTLIVRQFYGIQELRKAMSNRLQAYHKLGYYVKHTGEVFDWTVALEERIGKVVAEAVSHEPIYQAYLQHIDGIGPQLSAAIIACIGSIDRFELISALWAFGGLHVIDGRAPKRRRGEKANWNGELKTLITYKVPGQFIKLRGCFGRKLYDQYKAFYEQVHDERCPVWSHPGKKVNAGGTKATIDGKGCSRKGHIDNMAKRKLGKVFLACLWLAWRELESLPVTEPYAMKLDGHTHLVKPSDWTGGDHSTYQLRMELAREARQS